MHYTHNKLLLGYGLPQASALLDQLGVCVCVWVCVCVCVRLTREHLKSAFNYTHTIIHRRAYIYIYIYECIPFVDTILVTYYLTCIWFVSTMYGSHTFLIIFIYSSRYDTLCTYRFKSTYYTRMYTYIYIYIYIYVKTPAVKPCIVYIIDLPDSVGSKELSA